MTHNEFSDWEILAIKLIANRLESVEKETERLELELKELRKSKKAIDDLQQVYEDAANKRDEDQWCHYTNEVLDEKRIKKLRAMGDTNSVDLVNDLAIVAKIKAEKFVGDLVTALPEALASVGLPVDATSKFPKFTVKETYIKIEINEKSLKATITPSNGKSIDVNADITSILGTVLAENHRLFDKNFNASAFVEYLVTTLESIGCDQSKNSHFSVSWKEILKNWVGPKITADELGAQFGMTMGSSPELLTESGIFFNQEKGSEHSLKAYDQIILIGTIRIRTGHRRG